MMARGRKKKTQADAKNTENIETFYWKDFTYTCPVRGTVTEKIKVKKLKPQETPNIVSNYELEILKEELDDVE
jgi:hypothetical protein